MKRRTLVLAFASATAIGQERVDPRIPSYRPLREVSGDVTSVGSDTMNGLMAGWGASLAKRHPHVKVHIEGKGSSTAPPAFISGQAQVAPMSRPLRPAEIEAFAKRWGYKPAVLVPAIDAVAIFVNENNPLEKVTLRDIDRIFSKTHRRGGVDARTWGDLGLKGDWASKAISPYGHNEASGTYSFFKETVLASGDYRDGVKQQPGAAAVAAGVGRDQLGIGYGSLAQRRPGSKPLAVSADGVTFWRGDPEEVAAGKYPLARPLYIYVNQPPGKPPDPAVQEFLNFVLSREGQEIVARDGYVPLHATAVVQARAQLGLDRSVEMSPPPSPTALPSPSPTATPIIVYPTPPPSASPTPMASPSPLTTNETLDREMRAAYDRLDEGRLAYNPALEMTLGVPTEVVARVGPGSDPAGITSGFPVPPQVDTLKVSGVMEAHLKGDGSAFKIEALSPSAERALIGPFEEWRWVVTPLQPGSHRLHLTVVVRVQLSNKETRQKVISRSADIHVTVDRGRSIGQFIRQEWKWIVATLVSLLTGLLAFLRGRRETRKKEAELKELERKRAVGFLTGADDPEDRKKER